MFDVPTAFPRPGRCTLVTSILTVAVVVGCSDLTAPSAGPPAELVKLGGDGQESSVGTALPEPLAVRVTDAKGDPVHGAEVQWAVASGGGSIASSTETDSSGEARAVWTIGSAAGEQSVKASLDGLSATFTAVGTPGSDLRITVESGDGQRGVSGQVLPEPLAVRIEDEHGNPATGVEVSWSVIGGGGSFSPAMSVTGNDGRAVSAWTLGTTAGPASATAGFGGLAVEFTATATAGAPTRVVKLSGDHQTGMRGEKLPDSLAVRVTDAHDNPVDGIEVRWAVAGGGGSVAPTSVETGPEGEARAAWRLGEGGGTEHDVTASVKGLAAVTFRATGWSPPRLVVFGDSNFESGWRQRSPGVVARSYIGARDDGLNVGPGDPHHPTQLAGKIEAEWAFRHGGTISAVNHALGGTRTGTGRHSRTSPNAREAVNGVERYRAEVLGEGYLWHGGESGISFPDGPVQRVQAFEPTIDDFVVIGMGTNDLNSGVRPEEVRDNIRWMVGAWKNAGLPAENLILTTLPPLRSGSLYASRVQQTNNMLRQLASAEGVTLIDLVVHVSDDNGLTWKSAEFHVQDDELHYAEPVREWLAREVVSAMEAALPISTSAKTIASGQP